MNCWPSLIFTNLMLWPFKKQNLQLYCNSRIISGNLPIQCIQKRQESSRRWCNVTCSQGYPTHAHYRTEKQLESVWVKVFANKTSHYVASWYRQPNGTSEDCQLIRDQLDHIRNQHKGNKLPSVHILGDFNFKDIDWPDRLNKSGAAFSQSEEKIWIDIMTDHGLE